MKGKETWKDFERRVGLKRSGQDQASERRALSEVPNDILVQRMSNTPCGRSGQTMQKRTSHIS